jgi:hypothetical protein
MTKRKYDDRATPERLEKDGKQLVILSSEEFAAIEQALPDTRIWQHYEPPGRKNTARLGFRWNR